MEWYDIGYETDYLEHYGVLGMKWGQHKARRQDKKTRKEAKKDAKEYVNAKMFYGEGAGTRRKLINKSVNSKARKDPTYKKYFDEYVSNADYAKSANKARKDRKSIDRRTKIKKTTKSSVKAVKEVLGITGPIAVTAAAVYYKKNSQKVNQKVASFVSKYKNYKANKEFFKHVHVVDE